MNQWHKFDPHNPVGLKDRFYYLVTHEKYGTPMKAKWHEDMGGYFEVLGTWNDSERVRNGIECWHQWDEDNPITAWMDMPEIYKEE